MLRLWILWACCVIFPEANGQPDSVQIKRLCFDITGGAFFQQTFSGEAPAYRAPAYLQVRRPVEPDLANLWGLRNNNQVTDGPLGHGPMYIRPHAWYKPASAVELYASVSIDHRGASWGPYNTDNTAFIPRFHAVYSDWKKFNGRDSIRLFGKMGYFEDFRLNEGLTLYNIDVQGLQVGFQRGRFVFRTSRVGDLVRGYGLGIDGMTDYQVVWQGMPVSSSWRMDIGAGLQNMIGFPATGGDQKIVTAALGCYRNNTRLYVEAGYRATDFSYGLNAALLTGVSNGNKTGKLSLQWRAEYRYYGGGFNYQFRNEEATHFRDVNSPAGSNFIGDAIYPMSFFGRPFSQWAVFAEYDKPWIQGATLFGSVSYEAWKNIWLFHDLDLNGIAAAGERAFFYLFYNGGIKMNADQRSLLSISITNRTMNLDKHYTTYYLLEAPVFQFELKRTL